MIISTSGFYSTGSSAVFALLEEYVHVLPANLKIGRFPVSIMNIYYCIPLMAFLILKTNC